MENPKKNQESPGVSIAGLLSKNLIRMHLLQREKKGLMEYLAQELCAVKSLANPGLMLAEIAKREEGINTTLDTGLSIPHARIEGLAEFSAILGLPAKPIPDPKQADLPIRAMLLFLSPNRPEAHTQQLYLLRNVAMLFQNAFLDKLLVAQSAEQALQLIRDQENSLRKT